MAAGQHVIAFQIPAGDTSTIKLTGFGHAPEALIATWNGRSETLDTVGRADSHRGLGFAIGAAEEEQRCWSHFLVDGAPASETLSGAFSALVSIVKETGPGSPPHSAGTARLASIDEDGITFDITTAFDEDITVNLLSFGPELITNKALAIRTFPTVVGDEVIDGLGFQPNAVLLTSVGRDPDEPSFSNYCIGFAAEGIDQSLLVGYSRGNGASADTRRYCRNDYCLGLSGESPNVDVLERRASLTSFDTDGFTLNHDTVFSSNKVYGYLALEGPGFKAGGFNVGDEEVDGFGFTPRGGVFISAGQLESADAVDMQRHDVSSGGFAAVNDVTGLDQGGGATRSQDGTSTMDISTRWFFSGVAGGINEDVSADGLTQIDIRNDGFDIITPVPWAEGDVFVGYFAFGAPQPAVTDGRAANVPAGSQDPPVATYVKDPGSTLDYSLNWDAPLSDETDAVVDSIARSTWTAPTGIDIATSPPANFAGTDTRVWLSGGSAGKRYEVVNRIETLNGRVYERTIEIQVAER